MAGVLLSDDLIFTSRIAGTARALGLEMRVARTVAELTKAQEDVKPVCAILDLNHPELKIDAGMPGLKKAGVFVVGYGSHVAVEVLKAAREAGCDVVLPRSKFVEELNAALPRWFATCDK